MQPWLEAAVDLFLGAQCVSCQVPGASLCRACHEIVTTAVPELIERPGLDLPVVAASDYRPVLEHVIPAFKDEGALQLQPVLAQCLAAAVLAFEPPPETMLVPIASSPRNVRRRGIDHGRRLAAGVAQRTGFTWSSLLTRRDVGQSQRGLNRQARSTQLVGLLSAQPTPYPVIIVDDVVTTGSSLKEALRAHEAVGNRVYAAAVIANADRHLVPQPHKFQPG